MSDYYAGLAAGNDGACADGWRHRLGQWLRFEVVRRGLEIDGATSVVDVGCGTGRLLEYVGAGQVGRYVGVDRRPRAIDRARQIPGGHEFLCTDWSDRAVDRAGPFDYAVAIGTLVDGTEVLSESSRRKRLEALLRRLHELGTKGWALVVLDENWLRANPVRRLDRALVGTTKTELADVVSGLGIDELVMDTGALPSELFVIFKRDEEGERVRRRLAGDQAHQAVFDRAKKLEGQVDAGDRAWLWLATQRWERARQCIDEIPDGDRRKPLLVKRLDIEAQ